MLVVFLNRVLIHLGHSLDQSSHLRQSLLKGSVVIINIANTTDSSKFGCGFEVIMVLLEPIVVVLNVLKLLLVLLVSVVNVSEHAFVLRLTLYKFKESSESLSIFISIDMEINSL